MLIDFITFQFLEELKAKALAFEAKNVAAKRKNQQQKQIKETIHKNLPKIENTEKGVDENVISEYMSVLRETHEKIGQEMFKERLAEKKELKFKNQNYLTQLIHYRKNKNTLRRKIQIMRKEAVFPQPKSFMNYAKTKGILKKNSIKIN